MWPSHVMWEAGLLAWSLDLSQSFLSDFLCSCAKIEGTSALLEDSVSLKCGLHGMGNIGFTIFARVLFSSRRQYLTAVWAIDRCCRSWKSLNYSTVNSEPLVPLKGLCRIVTQLQGSRPVPGWHVTYGQCGGPYFLS